MRQSRAQIIETRGAGRARDEERFKEPAADDAKSIVAACREEGLLILGCGNYGNVIRTLAPLVITDEELEKGLSILEGAIRKADESL